MASDLPVPTTYGGLKPSGSVGIDDFTKHDHGAAWSDSGLAETMMLGLVPEVAAYGAEQAKQAIIDYTQNAFADVCVVQGELCVMIDVSNDKAPYAVFWRLTDLLQAAISGAENAADGATLKAIGRFHEQIGHTFRPPVTPAQPARPLRPGSVRPAGGAVRGGRTTGAQRPADPAA